MISKGSITFPKLLLIFLPSASLIIGCKNTSLKGKVSHKINDIITILETQNDKISCPVSKIEFGKNAFKSGFYSSGHPIVENGNKPEEYQVSKTSSS